MIGPLLARNARHGVRLLGVMVVGLAAFEVLVIYAGAMIETGPGFRGLLDLLPPLFRQLIESQLMFATFAAAPAFGFQHPFVLAVTIAYVIAAGTLPAAEREAGLLDLLLARPVSRWRYLAAVLGWLLVGAVILPLSVLGGARVGLALVEVPGEPALRLYLPCAAGLASLLGAIGGATLLVGVASQRRGLAIARAAGGILALLAVDFLAQFWAPMGPLRWISPFRYFQPVRYAVLPPAPAADFLVLGAAFAVTALAAFAWFARRDL